MTNSIDIAIPTMWRVPNFLDTLEKYCEYKNLGKIFLVDNEKISRPKTEVLNHPKIKLICYNKNTYVNFGWNEGYFRSKADVLCLGSDDVFVEESVFDFISNLDMTEIDIIGSYLKGSVDNYHIVNHPDEKEELIKLNINKNQPIGGQSYAFGVCMFIKRSSYRVIPSLYKIWYGDDYLVQRCEHVYALKTSKIHGEISKTIMELGKNKSTSVEKRIQLDSHNAYNYGHFKNGRNWEIFKKHLHSSSST